MRISNIRIYHGRLWLILALCVAGILSGCDWVRDDANDCPAELKLRFVYDYNIKFADAFAHEVTSVCVWAFDKNGDLVWQGEESGEILATPDFEMTVPLNAGKYDFVAWCGLKNNSKFDLATYTPSSKEELIVSLNTLEEEGWSISEGYLPGLYHGVMVEQEYSIDPYAPTYKIVTIPLVKDTNDIRIMLQHLDGSPIANRDFSVTLTYGDKVLEWNNAIEQGAPEVVYKPWNIRYGQTLPPGAEHIGAESVKATETVSSLLFELSTSRLMAADKAVLTVHRNWDDTDIIRINLTSYLLMVRGNYGNISDQEYLDRQDDYSVLFFIDENSNWYKAANVYINGWARVPPQEEEI
ncbi:MAG: FimB/Mfa2 family fimbrial subunit [Muribaculaceae bacterium]|nr:FimB/Mfa2 family fimbrial subunit [Muribaculaceae bacterium]